MARANSASVRYSRVTLNGGSACAAATVATRRTIPTVSTAMRIVISLGTGHDLRGDHKDDLGLSALRGRRPEEESNKRDIPEQRHLDRRPPLFGADHAGDHDRLAAAHGHYRRGFPGR